MNNENKPNKEPRQIIVKVRSLGDAMAVIGTPWENGEGFDLVVVEPDGETQTLEVTWAVFSAIQIIGETANYTDVEVEVKY